MELEGSLLKFRCHQCVCLRDLGDDAPDGEAGPCSGQAPLRILKFARGHRMYCLAGRGEEDSRTRRSSEKCPGFEVARAAEPVWGVRRCESDRHVDRDCGGVACRAPKTSAKVLTMVIVRLPATGQASAEAMIHPFLHPSTPASALPDVRLVFMVDIMR